MILVELLKQQQTNLIKERELLLSELDSKYTSYIHSLLKQKAFLTSNIMDKYDAIMRHINNSIYNIIENNTNNVNMSTSTHDLSAISSHINKIVNNNTKSSPNSTTTINDQYKWITVDYASDEFDSPITTHPTNNTIINVFSDDITKPQHTTRTTLNDLERKQQHNNINTSNTNTFIERKQQHNNNINTSNINGSIRNAFVDNICTQQHTNTNDDNNTRSSNMTSRNPSIIAEDTPNNISNNISVNKSNYQTPKYILMQKTNSIIIGAFAAPLNNNKQSKRTNAFADNIDEIQVNNYNEDDSTYTKSTEYIDLIDHEQDDINSKSMSALPSLHNKNISINDSICTGKIYYIHSNLHSEIYVSGKNLICNYCNELFTTHKDFVAHAKGIHSEYKPYRCNQCSTRYAKKSQLICHIERVHLEIVRYKCDECNKAFYYQTDYEKHKSIHKMDINDMSFKCYICNQIFAEKNNLCKHIQNVHTNV
eukprot:333284_1